MSTVKVKLTAEEVAVISFSLGLYAGTGEPKGEAADAVASVLRKLEAVSTTAPARAARAVWSRCW